MPSRLLAVILAAALASPAAADAQLSTTRGLSVGVHVIGTSLATENNDTRSGGGLSARLGYGFNRIVTGFVHVDGSEIEIPEQRGNSGITGEWSMAHAEIGARFHFANSLRRWVPYAETSSWVYPSGRRAPTMSGRSSACAPSSASPWQQLTAQP